MAGLEPATTRIQTEYAATAPHLGSNGRNRTCNRLLNRELRCQIAPRWSGDSGIRTRDIHSATVTLCRLSYVPVVVTGFEPATFGL